MFDIPYCCDRHSLHHCVDLRSRFSCTFHVVAPLGQFPFEWQLFFSFGSEFDLNWDKVTGSDCVDR